jgi:hypothetical protein
MIRPSRQPSNAIGALYMRPAPRGAMHRLAVTLLILLFAHSAWAEWVEYGSGNIPLISSYYDPTTIRKRGDMVTVWILSDLKTPIDGQGSRRALKEFDCKNKRNRTLQHSLQIVRSMKRCEALANPRWKHAT